MTLLTEILAHPLDPGYEAAARVREAAGLPAATHLRGPLLTLAAVLLGALLAASALTLRAPTTAGSAARQQLIRQITSSRTQGDLLSLRIAQLRDSIERTESGSPPAPGGALIGQVRQLELVTGAAAIAGPGLELTLDDAAAEAQGRAGRDSGADQRTGSPDTQGRVLGRDLQVVVNGLWQSGAEAIAVNNQRLTARSAIRFAGAAILVDYRPLTRPYLIAAIGPGTMETRFADSDAGAYLRALGATYGIPSSIAGKESISLSGGSGLTVQAARPGLLPPVASSTSRAASTPLGDHR